MERFASNNANNMSHVDFQTWIKDVMSKMIENLGLNIDETSYEVSKNTDYFMSTLYYIYVRFKNKTNDTSEEISVVLKRPIHIDAIREVIDIDSQFHNEILFYQVYAQHDENFPKCFYAEERPPADSAIALENVTKQGYCLCPYQDDAPLEYTLAAMREIGRFHGKGYVMKELQREKFFDIVGQLQESKFVRKTDNRYKILINITAPRAVEYLRSHGHDTIFCDKTETLLSNAYDEIMIKLVERREALSTLCHGDFTLWNLLFKTEDDGQHRAMLIDFATLRYATPVIDLSTYLCLCCSNEVRRNKFPEIMRAYHDALKEYLLEANIWDIEKYSYDALLDDYRRGGLFGFIIAAHFLPLLKGHCNIDKQEMVTMKPEEYAKAIRQAGGDEMSKIFADMLLHLRDLGCLKYF